MEVPCVNELQPRQALQVVQWRHLTVRNAFLAKMERSLVLAAGPQNLVNSISVACAAQGLHAVADGLIQNRLLDITAFDRMDST